jgi:hypothetical protein
MWCVRPYTLTGARRPHVGTFAWVTTAPHGILLGAWYVAVHGEPGSETGFARYRPTDIEAWFVSDQRCSAS